MTPLPDAFRMTEDELRRLGSKKWSTPPGVIASTVAEMDFGIAGEVAEALDARVRSGALGYLPEAEQQAMSRACAQWYRRAYGWEVPAEWVRPLPDVLRGLEVAIEHFSWPGSDVVLLTPAHVPFLSIPGRLGRAVRQVPLLRAAPGEWAIDLEAVEAALARGGGLVVFCNPHNPVGTVYRREEMAALAEVVERHGARVFSDEVYAPLVFEGHRHVPYASVSPAAAGHTVTATSVSKAWNLSGLKCAQLILSNERDAARWSEIAFLPEHGAGLLGAVATTAAYTRGHDWLAAVLEHLDGNRTLAGRLVAEHLPGVDYVPPQGTYLAWLDCTGLDLGPDPAAYFLEHARVAVNDGADCGAAGRGHVRLNLATPRPILAETLERMGHALAARP
ncbi:aminotransferase class I/II-fold pyridoxal phosphate-dependent enzyme [Citricoccus sp. SGAir0253]|uniref:MalY/PatB family protein n=1 Tax=Citricoccus sp. SGAir0253 TaxID=2567881 RepID=UPI0010CCB46E|nr:aminotransferase class I/II-fold pyridoxal phosphate-dependent enzyme [Citricoccus sp. SGAir0253]QCU77166.1 aminotransferase class I/II-fold pyridoxal phosphate-dependent enzyme [Citricoccus sp. SGAir0253]